MTEDLIEIDMYSVIKQKYIERDFLDKIRSEIAEEAKCTMNKNRAGGLYKALQIIDKYKEESEDKK